MPLGGNCWSPPVGGNCWNPVGGSDIRGGAAGVAELPDTGTGYEVGRTPEFAPLGGIVGSGITPPAEGGFISGQEPLAEVGRTNTETGAGGTGP